MHKRFRRQLAVGLSTVVAAGVIAITPAQAETDAVTRATAQLAQIQEESSQIDADYAEAEAKLTEAKSQLTKTEADIKTQVTKVDALKADLAELAIMQYQANGISITAQLLTAPDATSFLNSLATVNAVTDRANNQLQDVQQEQGKLDRLRATAVELADKAEKEKAKQAELKKEFDAKEKRAQDVVDRLRAEERARLIARQQEAARAAAAAAQPAPTSNGNSNQTPPKKAVSDGSWGTDSGTDRGQAVVNWARNQLGKPYWFGSSGPGGFDCSGLTSGAYRSIGISLPHQASAQWRLGTPVSKSDLQPGDLLFFYRGITHVGIYVGNGVMIHSAPSGKGVYYSNLSTYPAYQGARRVL